ncbi:maltose permease MAL61 [Colletotrichum lupini]|uniref:Maltose permease MAL61 n=1 Tax=Colletotrichum lupini TaxID=145971 RepID=A0A9Q8WB55_9PEZI|nr:maltose permease MAL61 [Colletotrichum lupini]UQC76839.1 maltose permease MAL61 [Colletotrichum lupini]
MALIMEGMDAAIGNGNNLGSIIGLLLNGWLYIP